MAQEKEFKMVSTSWMLPGVTCWILEKSDEKKQNNQDENAYIRGIIISLTPNRQHARMTYPDEKGPEEVPVALLFEANQDYENYKQGWPDMVQMNVLNEAEIIANIKLRYMKDLIFTFIGPTLIVMNPYKLIKSAFAAETLEIYQKKLFSQSFDMRDCPPHVYAISAQAYSQMFSSQKNQAIVISGESGAGKTENAKFAMKYLTSLSSYGKVKDALNTEVPIEDKILSCNPILEAFGNSKTVRNDNSSRFGKYVRMWVIKSSKKIIGASVSNYLLEKSRVTQLAQGERNFHVFYHMLKGLPREELEKLQLCDENKKCFPMNKFEFLNQSGCDEVDTIDDRGLFKEMMESFLTMKFSQEEIDGIFRVISGVLLFGNLEIDGSTLSDSEPCSVKDKQWLSRISKVLQIDEKAIENAILLKTREVVKQVIHSPNSLEECKSITISLSRALYDKLFNWLVKKLNQTIIPQEDTTQTLAIGLLDIFGFENFQINSFEQLCINFTNEKLQSLYIAYVFKSEEHEFIREGLKDYLQQLKYTDNQPIIDLIDKYPLSVFDLLDESCTLASATEEQLLQKISKTFADHAHLKMPKIIKDKFSIVHTPKEVIYQITGFRNKNKDEISKDLDRGVCSSLNECIVRFWRNQLEGEKLDDTAQKGSSKENKFLSAKFRKQMKDLMEELQSCDVHFIRCIKSNEVKRPDYFLNSYVLLQIRYLGILESVKVRKEGYPIRNEYLGFYTRYHELDLINKRITLKRHIAMGSDMKGLVREIVNRIFPQLDKKVVLYGNTKIYMKLEEGYKLDRLLQEWLKYKGEKAILIQRGFKHFLMKKRINQGLKKIHKLFLCIAKIQALVRMHQAKKRYQRKKRAIYIAKRYLVKTQRECLRRNLHKLAQQSKKQPRKEKNTAQILTKRFLPCMDKYHKRMALWKWREHRNNQNTLNLQQPQGAMQFQSLNDDVSQRIKQFESEINKFQIDQLLEQDEEQEEEKQEYDQQVEEEDIEQADDFELPTDHFELNGPEFLRIWSFEQYLVIAPLIGKFLKSRTPKKDQQSDEILSSKLKYHEINEQWKKDPYRKLIKLSSVPLIRVNPYQTSSERLAAGDYDGDFMEQVRDNNFFVYCDQNVFKGQNFTKQMDIRQIMSYNDKYLQQPLLPIQSHCKDAIQINRNLLKLCGVKRTRYTKEFLQEQILVLLLGANCVLPLPVPVEAYSAIDYNSKYENLRFQKEKKTEQLLPGYRAFQQRNEHKQREDNLVVYKQFSNLVKNKNINNIKEWQKDNQLQTALAMFRDEAYLQICRLLFDNHQKSVTQHLYKFACILSQLIGPTKKTIFAVLNFYLHCMENEVDETNKHFSRTIFNNLAKQAIQLNVLHHMHEISDIVPHSNRLRPTQWGTSYSNVSEEIDIGLIKKLKLYKRDGIQDKLTRIVTGLDSLYDMCSSALSVTSGRLLLPSWTERIYIKERKQLEFRLSLCNESIVWVPMEAINNLREVKNTILTLIGLDKLQQYYSFYQTVEIDGKEKEGFWCQDACKALDLVAKEYNDMEVYQEQYKNSIVIKVYLKIRVYYPIRKEDVLSREFFYQQLVQQVLKGELPVGVELAIELGSIQLYIEIQSQVVLVWPTQEQVCEKIHEYISDNLINGSWQNAKLKNHKEKQQTYTVQDWSRKVLRASSKKQFEVLPEAKWFYIQLLRQQDLFMAQQIKCSFHIISKGNFGLLRRKRFVPGYIGIRPSHLVVVDWPSRQTIKIIGFEDISQWGKAVGSDNLMFVKMNQNEILFMQMSEDGMESMDYLMNAYLNWEQCLPLDSHLVPPPQVQKTTFNLNMFNSAGVKSEAGFQDNQDPLDFHQNESFSQYNQYDMPENNEEFDYQLGNNSAYNYDF